MRLHKLFSFIFFIFAVYELAAISAQPIVPKDVLTEDEIRHIKANENFFMRDQLETDGPIWDHLDRRYGSHYLKSRDEFYSLKDVIHRTLSDGFPVTFKIQELYRAGLARHIAVGKLLPRLGLAVGQGMPPIDVNNFATNLFGFLLPQNWFSLIQANKANNATKYLFLKTVLDQYYAAELMFIELHQLIQEFEIRNFYFIHLQILSDYLGLVEEDNISLAGTFAALGTNVATNRGDIKLKFDDLAKVMALRTDQHGRYATDHININNIDDFPTRVKELKEMGEFYNNEEDFIKEVLKRSVELKSIKEFYDVAKLGVGVTAFGSVFSATDNANDNYVRLGVSVGYDTLPNILTSVSSAKTAKINVHEQFVNMVDLARRAFDSSTNAIGGFTEATRSMQINRKAFAIHLRKVLREGARADALFLQDFSNLVDAELKRNNALHGTLKAHAQMRRLLVTEEQDMLSYLPPSAEVEKIQRLFLSEYPGYSHRYGSLMSKRIHQLHRHKDLQTFLNGDVVNVDKQKDNYSKENIKQIVSENISDLIHRRRLFHNKHEKFYRILNDYVEQNHLHLTLTEERLLKERAGIHVDEIEFGEENHPHCLLCRHR